MYRYVSGNRHPYSGTGPSAPTLANASRGLVLTAGWPCEPAVQSACVLDRHVAFRPKRRSERSLGVRSPKPRGLRKSEIRRQPLRYSVKGRLRRLPSPGLCSPQQCAGTPATQHTSPLGHQAEPAGGRHEHAHLTKDRQPPVGRTRQLEANADHISPAPAMTDGASVLSERFGILSWAETVQLLHRSGPHALIQSSGNTS